MESKTQFKRTEIGKIPEDWKIKSTEELLLPEKGSLKIGPFGSQLKKEFFVSEGFKVYGQENVFKNNFSLGSRYITKERFEFLRSCELKPGDFLISMMGTIGFVTIVPEDIEEGIMDSHLLRLRIDESKFYKRFLLYVFRSNLIQNQISSLSVGTIMEGLSSNIIKKLTFPCPNLEEQRSIASILSSLDSKIELNQQMNKTLEAIGKTIFKHWFVDFEFPNKEGKPYKSSGGEMVYNEELGKEIPKGEEVKRFSEVIEVNPKRELPKGKIATKVGMSDLRPWQSWVEGRTFEEYKSGPKFKNGDTLFARITPSLENGKTAFVSILRNNEVGFGSTEFIVFDKKVISSPLYIFHLCRSKEIRNAAINAMTGTSGRQRVPDSLFDYLSIVLPPFTLIDEFEKITSPLFNKISKNANKIKMLSQVRNSLLPKLMSGKIRVPVEVR